jgi:hypothetical protein
MNCRLIGFHSALSMLFCTAAAGLWLRSYFASDLTCVRRPGAIVVLKLSPTELETHWLSFPGE